VCVVHAGVENEALMPALPTATQFPTPQQLTAARLPVSPVDDELQALPAVVVTNATPPSPTAVHAAPVAQLTPFSEFEVREFELTSDVAQEADVALTRSPPFPPATHVEVPPV
jgi:hypothetical protein